MIVGSGLVASEFQNHLSKSKDICIYAAGVSNSSCTDNGEFFRDETRLNNMLSTIGKNDLFVYFSTCSLEDPSQEQNEYVLHKRYLEDLVRKRDNYLVVRLPQIAGKTVNPHTILNYLFGRISRSECFNLWVHARRNIIDITDVVTIVLDLIYRKRWSRRTVNVANSKMSSMLEIVKTIEYVTRKHAIYNLVDRGASYSIDVSDIEDSVLKCGIKFDGDYLLRTVRKYYE